MKNFFIKNRIILLAAALILVIAVSVGGYLLYQNLVTESVDATVEDEITSAKKATETEESSENSSEEENQFNFEDLSHLSRHAPNMYINWQHSETEYDAVTIDWKCTEDAWGTYWAAHTWDNGYAGFQNIFNNKNYQFEHQLL